MRGHDVICVTHRPCQRPGCPLCNAAQDNFREEEEDEEDEEDDDEEDEEERVLERALELRRGSAAGSGGGSGARLTELTGQLVPADVRLPGSPGRRRARFAVGPPRSGSTSSLVKAALYQKMHGRSQSLPFIQKTVQKGASKETSRLRVDTLTTILSALYAKLLVVLGIAFPMAETISAHVPISFYEGFYVFLYAGSMLFLLLLYCCLLKERALDSVVQSHQAEMGHGPRRKISATAMAPRSRYGSFYLRMGAVAFGIGSMIYSGLEFGQFFELDKNPKCYNVMLAVTPIARMIFIIMQMQFIFLSNKQLKVRTYQVPMRFGLMHMIACNLCVWLNVLIQETKHEIISLYSPHADVIVLNGSDTNTTTTTVATTMAAIVTSPLFGNSTAVDITDSGFGRLKGIRELTECRRTNIMGSLVQNASPFLFPCTIEYSLICAVILYAMWKDVNTYSQGRQGYSGAYGNKISSTKAPSTLHPALHPGGQSGQQISVDCASAHKGLFAGVLVLVLTILSLILFCVLNRERALLQINSCELTLYTVAVIATMLCMWRMRHLEYDCNRRFELDNMLLVMAQSGLYVFTLFSIIAGYFSDGAEEAGPGVVVMSVSALLQTTLQTVFVLDAWWRRCGSPLQARAKPGRQLVTFLLVTNMALWAVSRLQNSRADFHPVELRFYGFWAWTIITHVAMPLSVFYRFHSTVCLCEIWKSTYKMRLPARK